MVHVSRNKAQKAKAHSGLKLSMLCDTTGKRRCEENTASILAEDGHLTYRDEEKTEMN